ncbi:MAG: IS1595 family transposase [Micrococcaceae bacterium]|nr:IS1595 family transposase [Micrococcaceae bacterium]
MADSTVGQPADHLAPGRDYPRDLTQFRAWFATDEACADYLDWLRFADGFQCQHCGSQRLSGRAGRRRCTDCDGHISVTAGTVLERTRTPLTVWFEAAWLMVADKSGVSATHLHRVLPIASYQTAWTLLAKLRSVMGAADAEPLSGRVEVDETFFGGPRPGVRGRGALGKTLVAGAIELSEHGWGRARLAIIEDASAATLQAFAEANIAVGSTVVTDAWSAYPSALVDYRHEPFNVSASGQPAHESLSAIHRLFALVKREIEGTYQGAGSVEHLQEYLDEFIFRFSRRHSRWRGLVFMRLLQRAVTSDPVTYQHLIRTPRSKNVPPPGVTGPRSQPGSLQPTPAGRPWRSGPQ